MSWSHRLQALELSSSDRMIPSTMSSSRLSLFERHLAKYRSLSFLWFRTCSTPKRQTIIGDKNTILSSFNYFGKLEI